MPASDAWRRALGRIHAAEPDVWAAALEAAAQCLVDGTAPDGSANGTAADASSLGAAAAAASAATDGQPLVAEAHFVLRRLASWGQADEAAIVEALTAADPNAFQAAPPMQAPAATAAAGAWLGHQKAIATALRKRVMLSVSTAGSTVAAQQARRDDDGPAPTASTALGDATTAGFLRYESAEVAVVQAARQLAGDAADKDEGEEGDGAHHVVPSDAAAVDGHAPQVYLTLPDDGVHGAVPVALGVEDVYALFAELDAAQNAIDTLMGAREPRAAAAAAAAPAE